MNDLLQGAKPFVGGGETIPTITFEDAHGRTWTAPLRTAQRVPLHAIGLPAGTTVTVSTEDATEGMNRAERRAYWSDRRRIERRIREKSPTCAMRRRGP